MTIEQIIKDEIKTRGLRKGFVAQNAGMQGPSMSYVIKGGPKNLNIDIVSRIFSVFDPKFYFLNGKDGTKVVPESLNFTTIRQLHNACDGMLFVIISGKKIPVSYEGKAKKAV